MSEETGAIAATGPEGNRGQPSPPGAVFFVATLKTFLVTGLIAAVVVIVVSLLARRTRRG